MATVATRPMTPSDLAEVARLHESSLEAGFFGRLGRPFLEAYYETFIASPYGIARVIGDRPDAMLAGTIHNELHYSWVLRHRGARLAIRGALALIRRPRVLVDFLRTRLARYVRGAKRVATPQANGGPRSSPGSEQVAVLTHVAVSPLSRRQGFGARLVNLFVAAARTDGADRALLVTLEESPGTHDFYLGLGWDPIGSKVDKDGRSLTMFELRLKDASSA